MANENMVRITKAQKFNAAITLLSGGDPVVIPDKDDKKGATLDAAYLCDFFREELALLAKKNTSDKKPTQIQKENEEHKERILAFLMGQTEGKTCTDIQKGVPEFAGMNNQKIASLMRQLFDAGQVIKEVIKGKSLFSIA